jgi:hypothetical protein
MNEQLTAAQIRARLLSADNVYGPPGSDETDEWGDVFGELLKRHDMDVLVAWTHAQENHDSAITVDPSDLYDLFQQAYRGYWDSSWEFARDGWAADLQAFGSRDEQKGRENFMRDFSPYIDWRAVADSPLLSGFTVIRMGGDDDARVHVFEITD